MKLLRLFFILLFLSLTAFFLFSNPAQTRDRKELNILIWNGCISPDSLSQFTKETGIPVNISYYTSNEELITKLKATKGQGYDLITPSDYAISILKKNDLLKPLDHEKVLRFNDIDPFLCGYPFDPDNAYSLPYLIDVLGFGISKSYFEKHHLSCNWDSIFNHPHYKISVSNDPIEHFNLASFYLFDKIDNLTPAQIKQVENLLIQQKNWVEAFTSFRAEYILATQQVPLALGQSSNILCSDQSDIEYRLPEKGTFISIDSLCIPQGTPNEDKVYQLINYLYRPDVFKDNANLYHLFPAIEQPDSDLYPIYTDIKNTMQSPGYRLLFFKHTIPEEDIRRLWIKVKG